jgi:hypothetical protein
MPLVKEDGTGVSGANTYADAADMVAYAAERGIEIPVATEDQEKLLVRAMDYLETLDARFLGYRTADDQLLSWPRWGVYFNGRLFSYEAIPPELVKAQVVIAIAAQTIDLFPTASGEAHTATRKTVGPITVEYAWGQQVSATLRPVISQADALLGYLTGSTGQLRVIRG